jgi:hypothetical protein
LEVRAGDVSGLAFMGLNVRLGDNWKGDAFRVAVNKMYRKIEGGGMAIDRGIWKEAEYNSTVARLKIYAPTPPASPTKEEVANFLGTNGVVGGYPAYFLYNGDAASELLTAVWYCEENRYLYIVEITYPEGMQEEVGGILSGFECVGGGIHTSRGNRVR